jgi:hypothetical protein
MDAFATRDRRERGKIALPLLVEMLIVWVVLTSIYVATLGGSHADAEDSLQYASDVRDLGPLELIHAPYSAYHLVYGVLGWAAYRLSTAFGYGGGPLVPMQILNAILGAVGIAILWGFLRSLLRGWLPAVAGCGALAFSYAYWWYSVEVEVYVLSTLFLIVTFWLTNVAVRTDSTKWFVALGLANGCAVLAHDTNVLFAVVVLIAVMLSTPDAAFRERLWRFVAYGFSAAVVVVPAYAVAVVAGNFGSPGKVNDWLTGYAGSDANGRLEMVMVPRTGIGLGRAIFGGHFAFAWAPLRNRAVSAIGYKDLTDEIFLTKTFDTRMAVFLVAMTGIAFLYLLVLVGTILRNRSSISPDVRNCLILACVWAAVYAVFVAWWEPLNVEFWIPVLTAIAIVFALIVSLGTDQKRRSQLRTVAILAPVATLTLINLVGSVGAQQNSQHDYWRVRAAWYEQSVGPGDVVLVGNHQLATYIRYFSGANVIEVDQVIFEAKDADLAMGELRSQLDEMRPKRVFFSEEILAVRSQIQSSNPDTSEEQRFGALLVRFLDHNELVHNDSLETVRLLKSDPGS